MIKFIIYMLFIFQLKCSCNNTQIGLDPDVRDDKNLLRDIYIWNDLLFTFVKPKDGVDVVKVTQDGHVLWDREEDEDEGDDSTCCEFYTVKSISTKDIKLSVGVYEKAGLKLKQRYYKIPETGRFTKIDKSGFYCKLITYSRNHLHYHDHNEKIHPFLNKVVNVTLKNGSIDDLTDDENSEIIIH